MPRVRFAVLGAIVVVAAGGSSFGEPTATEALTTCLAEASDYTAVYPLQKFPAGHREVRAVFRLQDGETFTKLTSTWIAVDVGDVAPPNTQIGTGDLPLEKRRVGVLRYSLPRDLPVGAYRLDVAADGKPWASTTFEVVASAPPPSPIAPADLLPLAKGTSWAYDFAAEAAKGVTMTLPGTTPDAAGVLRTKATYVVVGEDAAGTHLEMRRGEELASEEWWRLTDAGLVVTQRRADGVTEVLDPPRPAFPLPAAATASWTHEPKGGAKVEAQAWGPFPVATPKGEAPGWVILEREPLSFGGYPAVQSIERHWVPGVGLVREVRTLSLNAKRALRMEMVLR
jgi:hypothetical protein